MSIETSMMDMSALGGDGISIQVRGRDLDTLQQMAKEVAAIVEATEGTAKVSDGLEEATGEMRILIDRDKAMDQGLTVAEVYQQIAAKLKDASSATTFETTAKEYEVYRILLLKRQIKTIRRWKFHLRILQRLRILFLQNQ